MANSENTYPEDPRSTVNRYRQRAAYDFETIHSLINTAPVLHVSFVPSPNDPFPTILPMIGAAGSFSAPSSPLGTTPQDIYLHGYVSSRLMKLPNDASAEFEGGLPVCVCATHVDGYILALTPMHHSMNYRSAVVHGYASLVTSPEERLFAVELITNAAVPSRWANSRVPPTKAELQQTSVLKVSIVSASAKIRAGGPNEDKKDEQDEDVRGKVWTGVVPSYTVLGEPVPAETNRVNLPGYLSNWVEDTNQTRKKIAHQAIQKKSAAKE